MYSFLLCWNTLFFLSEKVHETVDVLMQQRQQQQPQQQQQYDHLEIEPKRVGKTQNWKGMQDVHTNK